MNLWIEPGCNTQAGLRAQRVLLTLTLPLGFDYDAPGKSPAAHVFAFRATAGFDLHYPPNEVTSMVTQTRSGQGVNIDLSSVGKATTRRPRVPLRFSGSASSSERVP